MEKYLGDIQVYAGNLVISQTEWIIILLFSHYQIRQNMSCIEIKNMQFMIIWSTFLALERSAIFMWLISAIPTIAQVILVTAIILNHVILLITPKPTLVVLVAFT